LPLGFDPAHLWITPIDLTQQDRSDEAGRAIQTDLLERVRALPGVRDAAFAFMTPFGARRMANDVFWMPPDGTGDRRRTNVDMNVVGPGYFDVMQIPLLRGRSFEAGDRSGAPDVAIVNRALAERLWPSVDPLGRMIWSWKPRGTDRGLRVVGVVENGRYYRSWRAEARPFLFLPAGQWYQGSMALHVRSASIGALDLRRVISDVAPTVPAVHPVRARDAMAASMSLEQTGARLLGAFGLLALTIAAIGIYSVVAFAVGERRYEIGVRMALGARRATVLRSMVMTALTPLLIGVAAGWLAAIGLTRLMSSLLYGVRPTDPVTYSLVAATLVGAGVLASLIPARRATRADPLQTLRSV
jgi:predicted permease